jgi:hypothetical protein
MFVHFRRQNVGGLPRPHQRTGQDDVELDVDSVEASRRFFQPRHAIC